MPVVGAGDVVPGPVGRLEVLEDDPRFLIFLIGLAPDIHVSRRTTGTCTACALKPRMLIGRVVGHKLRDHPHPSPVCLGDELAGVRQTAEHRVHVGVVGDVVAVVSQR